MARTRRRSRSRRRRWRSLTRSAAFIAALLPLAALTILAVHYAGLVTGDEEVAPVRAPLPAPPAQAASGAAAGEGESSDELAVRVPDRQWVERVAEVTGIPSRALQAYASADLTLAVEQPDCGIAWNTLAGIGAVESGHGSHGSSALASDGWVSPRIVGPALNGDGVAAIADTDGGAWDGDDVWDRAVGPLQFIPETWRHWGADGNLDGIRDPNHIDDAALAAGRYLCHSGSMDGTEAWRAAILRYNPLTAYVDSVAARATEYATLALR